MKKILFLSVCLFVIGCTAPSQRIASEAMTRGMQHTSDIVYDLTTLAKQQATDLGVEEVKRAVLNKDENAVVAAVEKTGNTINRIGWLQLEYEKAKSYLRLSQMYIASQQGVLDLLYKDFQQVQRKAASQPAQD